MPSTSAKSNKGGGLSDAPRFRRLSFVAVGGAFRRSLQSADWVLILLLLAPAALAAAFDALSDQRLQSIPRIVVGLLFAVVPAIAWVAIFYRQDRVEPEPKHLVATVAVVAALAAAALSEPLVQIAPSPGGFMTWIVAILIVGMTREFTKYLTVRLIAVPANEINETADGVVYGTAAGVGYATAMNVSFVVSAMGATPAHGFAFMTAVVLVHGALGGFIGYLVGRDSLEVVPIWWLPAGLLVAATVNGVFFEARSLIGSGPLSPDLPPLLGGWLGIGLALVVAAGMTLVLMRAMRLEERSA